MKALLFLLLLMSFQGYAQQEADIYISTSENYFDSHEVVYNYLLANDVNLRAKPNSKSQQLENLKIGQNIIVLKRSEQMDSIKGIKANWYQVKTDSHKGWIWGGYISQNSFGSQSNTAIKFVYGLEKIVLKDGWYQKYYQIRAFKDTVQLDKVVFKSYSTYIEYVVANGSMGLSLDDVITIGIPCVGGCGCSTGELVIFWNGKQFSEVEYLLGTADAWASEYTTFTYPVHMEGIPDKIIKTEVLFIDATEDGKVTRKKIVEHFIWTGNRLVSDKKFKKTEEIYVIDQ